MEIKGLNFCYPGETPLFKDFSFSSSSPLIVFKGHSGCGKTTLLKIIFGSIEGSLSVEKVDSPADPFIILQDDALCPWLTGIQNITSFLPINPRNLEHFSLYQHTRSFIHKKACNMSFGQRRLIELLRALVFKPKLLLLDEPLNYLDSQSRSIVVGELTNFINDGDHQVLLTDHFSQSFGTIQHEVYSFPETKPITALNRE